MRRPRWFFKDFARGLGSAILAVLAVAPLRAAPVTIVDNGDPSNRVDMVFLGDGYTQANLNAGIYDQHIQGYLSHMFSPTVLVDPFSRYQKFFNVHQINVVSNQSGADIPSQGSFVDTALDATYESFGTAHLLTISDGKANTIRNQQLAGTGITADMQLVTVNHANYGGSGGPWATFAGANSTAHEIELHELGHSFANLGDEYVSYPGQSYPYSEPSAPNLTKNPSGAKWAHWMGFDDPRGSNLDIGVFQGGGYYASGIYRPSTDNKMQSLNRAFDAVGREALIHKIYQHVDPLDTWLDNSAPVSDVDLTVDVVDPDVIKLKWYVDGALVSGAGAEVFNPSDFGYGAGTYTVRAVAYDDVIDHAFQGGLLDLVRTRFDLLQQEVVWTLTLSAADGDHNDNGWVDAADYVAWRKIPGRFGGPSGFSIWQGDFGQASIGSGDALGPGSVIPEPSAVFQLLGVLSICAAGFRKRRLSQRFCKCQR